MAPRSTLSQALLGDPASGWPWRSRGGPLATALFLLSVPCVWSMRTVQLPVTGDAAAAQIELKATANFTDALRRAPKVELHTHLDGSLQPETLCELAMKNNASWLLNVSFLSSPPPVGCRVGVRGSGQAAIHAEVGRCGTDLTPYVTSFHTSSLTQFLQPFTCISDFLRLPGGIETMGASFVAQQAAENVAYTEGQFAPQLLLQSCNPFSDCDPESGAVKEEVRQIVLRTIDGIAAAEVPGVRVRVLLDCFRSMNVSFCDQLLHVASEIKQSKAVGSPPHRPDHSYRYSDYVVGINLAGDEIKFPNSANPGGGESFQQIFQRWRPALYDLGLGFTPHSGEPAFAQSAADCDSAFATMGASRIGHGYHCTQSRLKSVAARRLHIEVCPSSSVATGAVPGWAHHPILSMLQHGVGVSLNTDDRAVIGTTMLEQHQLARSHLNFSLADLARAGLKGIGSSFAPLMVKKEVCLLILAWWATEARIAGSQWVAEGAVTEEEIPALMEYLETEDC